MFPGTLRVRMLSPHASVAACQANRRGLQPHFKLAVRNGRRLTKSRQRGGGPRLIQAHEGVINKAVVLFGRNPDCRPAFGPQMVKNGPELKSAADGAWRWSLLSTLLRTNMTLILSLSSDRWQP